MAEYLFARTRLARKKPVGSAKLAREVINKCIAESGGPSTYFSQAKRGCFLAVFAEVVAAGYAAQHDIARRAGRE